MDINVYQPMDKKTKQHLLNKLEKTLEGLADEVQQIKDWIQMQTHLPEEPSDCMIESFLTMCRFDTENTKEKLDNYYAIRNQVPEVFSISNPTLPSMIDTMDFTQIVPLPRLANFVERIIVVKLKNPFVPIDFDPNSWLAAILNVFEVLMQQALILDNTIIYDYEHLSLAHVTHITPSAIMNCAKIFEKIFCNNLRFLHVINYPPIFQIILTLCKPLLKPTLFEKFRLHNNIESLAKDIPLDALPKDYGGKEKSLDELERLWREKLVEFTDRFDKLHELIQQALKPLPLNSEPTGLFESLFELIF